MLTEATIAALTLGITQVLKPVIKNTDYHPVLALGIGIALGLLAWPMNGSPTTIISGAIAGLMASGAYKTIKDTARAIRSGD